MLNCCTATSRPRYRAGEISAMYSGETTEAPPIPRPPRKRKKQKQYQLQGIAQPMAEMKYSTATTISAGRRPKRSAGRPAATDPTMVPIRAAATVKPSQNSSSANTCFRASVVPEMTAVSKPNNRPPKAATSVLPSR